MNNKSYKYLYYNFFMKLAEMRNALEILMEYNINIRHRLLELKANLEHRRGIIRRALEDVDDIAPCTEFCSVKGGPA